MDVVWQGIRQAFELLWDRDPDLLDVLALSLRVSLTATGLALLLGLPLGMALATSRFLGRRMLLASVYTGMALPPVVVGLVVSVLLWRSGPLGALNLLYTPTAMVIAQTALALPIVVGLTAAAIQQVDPELRLQMRALGASRLRSHLIVALEARLPLLAAVMAAFGAAISEVGAAMMVGGNIYGHTRVLTTAAVLETSKGNFGMAIAFGLILLALAFLVILTLTLLQQRGRGARQ